jgi:hypothetical protein
MRTVIEMNKVVIAELFSSTIKTEKLLAENWINMSELRKRNIIRINKNYTSKKYTNSELPKGMEAHIIALINGALS